MDMLAVLVALVVRTFFFEPFSMEAGSMMPTLMPGDVFLVSRGGFEHTPPARGDVVVFRLPSDPSVSFVKRLVGLPGDTVQMIDGILQLNGRPVPRRPAGELVTTDRQGQTLQIARYTETLPGGRGYDVLDMTDGSFLDNTPPMVVPEGHVFVLGDHRDNSVDSRLPSQVGFVPLDHMVGRATFLWPDVDADGVVLPRPIR